MKDNVNKFKQKPKEEDNLIAIISDLHGTNIEKIRKRLDNINPDKLICLGDFDQVKTIRNYIELEEDLKRAGKQVLTVKGNHDDAILKGLPILSGTFKYQKTDAKQLATDLKNDKKAGQYLQNLPITIKDTIKIDDGKTSRNYDLLIVHGGIAGNLDTYKNCPEQIKPLWYRFENVTDPLRALSRLQDKEKDILVRGHDHLPRLDSFVKYSDENNDLNQVLPHDLVTGSGKEPNALRVYDKQFELKLKDKNPGSLESIDLNASLTTKRTALKANHIITTGAAYNGIMALLEVKNNKLFLSYKNI